jgi:hypothetical protein
MLLNSIEGFHLQQLPDNFLAEYLVAGPSRDNERSSIHASEGNLQIANFRFEKLFSTMKLYTWSLDDKLLEHLLLDRLFQGNADCYFTYVNEEVRKLECLRTYLYSLSIKMEKN